MKLNKLNIAVWSNGSKLTLWEALRNGLITIKKDDFTIETNFKDVKISLFEDKNDEICCEYCTHQLERDCPIKDASPWSKWGNFCNNFEKVEQKDE